MTSTGCVRLLRSPNGDLSNMNAEPGTSANFGAIDDVGAASLASPPFDKVASSKRFKIIFLILVAAVQSLWLAFLAWLVIHAI
jgi:hypothetical protein